MTPSKVLGIAASLALVAGVGYFATAPDVVTLEAVEIRPEEVKKEVRGESKVQYLDDGGKVYVTPVDLVDGGTTVKVTTEAPCKRRPRDGRDCQHVSTGPDGIEVTSAAPEMNRYPADSMAGDGCEPVACSVFFGENADAEERK